MAIFRPSDGSWWLNRSTAGIFVTTFGFSTNKIVAADYTGDGKADIGVFRPDGANWFIQRSTAGILIQQFGANGDLPTAASFIP